MNAAEINKAFALISPKFRKGCVDYLAAMSPYNFDPEADALAAELKAAEESRNVREWRIVRDKIMAFVKRKTAAREATK